MSKSYFLVIGFAFLIFNKTAEAQSILLDDNHSLSGIPLNGQLILTSGRDSTIWTSDGTPAGTKQVATVKSINEDFGVLDNILYFSGADETHGAELWQTDGTAEGTLLVSDVWAGSDSSKPSDFIVSNNKLYFTANTPATGRELYEYSGSGTPARITDINGGAGNSFETPHFWLLNNLLYFDAANAGGKGVYALQSGSVSKIFDIPSGYSLDNFIHLGNVLFFSISNGADGLKIYKTSGINTPALVKSFTGALSGFLPPQMITWNNKIYFTAAESGFDVELWATDGTTTTEVADINPGANGSHPTIVNSVVLNGKLVFSANTDESGYELWSTDGTSAGTRMLKDINTEAAAGSVPFLLVPWNGYSNIHQELENSDYYNRTANFNGSIFFTADNGTNGVELYKTDGTENGTVLVKDINPSGNGAGYFYIYTQSGLVFDGDNGIDGLEPWMSDGTGTGTSEISNVNPAGNADPEFFFIWNSDLYFSADNGNGGVNNYRDLYKLQGPFSPLPVTLNSLKAVAQKDNVLLAWTTSSENNTDKFNIMRSVDGINFSTIGSMQAAGQSMSPKNYSFLDQTAYLLGVDKLFYRLETVDRDARISLSKIVAVALDLRPFDLALYPNPAHNLLNIIYNTTQRATLYLMDLDGKILHKSKLPISTGTLHLDLSAYPSGTYIIRFVQNNKTTVRKFVKR